MDRTVRVDVGRTTLVAVIGTGGEHRLMGEYDRYYEVVRRIPRGRVATYGGVAGLAGLDGRARRVGYAMAALRLDDVPWHRVVNARGEISPRGSGGAGARIQRALLEDEGVAFDDRGRIDLERFGWP